jgi:hypothetical protein
MRFGLTSKHSSPMAEAPKHFAASVRPRLLMLARQTDQPFDAPLTRFVHERRLYRPCARPAQTASFSGRNAANDMAAQERAEHTILIS